MEEFTGLGMPRPAQISREIGKRKQWFREDGAHGESTDSLHTFYLRRRLRIEAAAPRCASAHHPGKASFTGAPPATVPRAPQAPGFPPGRRRPGRRVRCTGGRGGGYGAGQPWVK
ncbi:hypothetical protein GCM10017778_11140 [Streptomyces vinaceus]|nr:hypothetical protein GCM10017778_11140 [Streptomyces vinaceus]